MQSRLPYVFSRAGCEGAQPARENTYGKRDYAIMQEVSTACVIDSSVSVACVTVSMACVTGTEWLGPRAVY